MRTIVALRRFDVAFNEEDGNWLYRRPRRRRRRRARSSTSSRPRSTPKSSASPRSASASARSRSIRCRRTTRPRSPPEPPVLGPEPARTRNTGAVVAQGRGSAELDSCPRALLALAALAKGSDRARLPPERAPRGRDRRLPRRARSLLGAVRHDRLGELGAQGEPLRAEPARDRARDPGHHPARVERRRRSRDHGSPSGSDPDAHRQAASRAARVHRAVGCSRSPFLPRTATSPSR